MPRAAPEEAGGFREAQSEQERVRRLGESAASHAADDVAKMRPDADQNEDKGGQDDLLIRRNGHIVQDRPSRSLCWGDIPHLSMTGRRCPPSWQQICQQYRRPGPDGFQDHP
jgi:hypothetical protein